MASISVTRVCARCRSAECVGRQLAVLCPVLIDGRTAEQDADARRGCFKEDFAPAEFVVAKMVVLTPPGPDDVLWRALRRLHRWTLGRWGFEVSWAHFMLIMVVLNVALWSTAYRLHRL